MAVNANGEVDVVKSDDAEIKRLLQSPLEKPNQVVLGWLEVKLAGDVKTQAIPVIRDVTLYTHFLEPSRLDSACSSLTIHLQSYT